MKPKARLFSSSQSFSNYFKSQLAGTLDFVDDNVYPVDYFYVFAKEDSGLIESALKSWDKKSKLVIAEKFSALSSFNFQKVGSCKLILYKDLLEDVLDGLKQGRPLEVEEESFEVNTIAFPELTRAMTESSFTYFSQNLEKFYISSGITSDLLTKILSEFNFSPKIVYSNKPKFDVKRVVMGYRVDYIKKVFETSDSFDKQSKPRAKLNLNPIKRIFTKKVVRKAAWLALALPVLLTAISVSGLFFGYYNLDKNPKLAGAGFLLSKKTALLPEVRESAKLGSLVLGVSDAQDFDFSDSTPDDLQNHLTNLRARLNEVYKQMSYKKDSFLFRDEVLENRQLILQVHNAIDVSPFLLGLHKETKYLLLKKNQNLIEKALFFEIKDAEIVFIKEYTSEQMDSAISGHVDSPFSENLQYSFANVLWEGDLPSVSKKSIWFSNKSHGFNPEIVAVTQAGEYESLRKLIESTNNVLDLDFLRSVMAMAYGQDLTAFSSIPLVQSYFQDLNIDSGLGNADMAVFLSSWSMQDTGEMDKSLFAELVQEKEKTRLVLKLRYSNTNSNKLLVWPSVIFRDELVLEDISPEGQNGLLANPEVRKSGGYKQVAFPISIEPKEVYEIEYVLSLKRKSKDLSFLLSQNILESPTDLRFTLVNKSPGIIKTKPRLNLTANGELSYTTFLKSDFRVDVEID